MKYWRTQTGEKIAIKDMTTSHIENCIAMLERNRPDFEFEAIGADEFGFNFTAASLYADAEEWDERIKVFKKELKRRSNQSTAGERNL